MLDYYRNHLVRFSDDCGIYREEQRERLNQDLKGLEQRYQG